MRLHAVLIVRNEEQLLPGCLAALSGIADVVHVHDTGSADATVALARAAGATVSCGGWPEDFAIARNEALRQAGPFGPSDWVLSIDADETVTADPGALRALLATDGLDGSEVEIDNDRDDGAYAHRAVRLFRPAVAAFRGSVHEHVARVDDRSLRVMRAPRSTIMLRHSGYQDDEARRRKGERNAVIARELVDRLERGGAGTRALSRAVLDLGRSELAAGRRSDAAVVFRDVVRRWPVAPVANEAREFLARQALAAGNDQEVLRLVDELRASGAGGGYADWLAAQSLAQLGDIGEAVRLLDGVTELVDSAGRHYDGAQLAEMRGLLAQLAALTA